MRSTYHTSHGGQQIKTLKKTSKAFLIEYGCGFFLLSLLGFSYLKEINLNSKIIFLLFGMAMVSFGSAGIFPLHGTIPIH